MSVDTCPRCKGELLDYEPGESFHVEEIRNLGVCFHRPDGCYECVNGSGVLPPGWFRLEDATTATRKRRGA